MIYRPRYVWAVTVSHLGGQGHERERHDVRDDHRGSTRRLPVQQVEPRPHVEDGR